MKYALEKLVFSISQDYGWFMWYEYIFALAVHWCH